MRYKIGTRGSALALAQTGMVCEKLRAAYPEHEFEIVVISTAGDRTQNVPIAKIGTKGVFVREIEDALLENRIDLAVHSMKDMPALLPDGLELAPACFRSDTQDVLVLKNAPSIAELPEGAIIGTGSLRRSLQLKRLRSDLRTVDIRGNIDTRLKKLETGDMDGIVLAAAALKRLGLEERITVRMTPDQMIPAAAQGALAIEIATARKDVRAILAPFANARETAEVAGERRFLELMNGGCEAPVGARCEQLENGKYRIRTLFADVTTLNPVYMDIIDDDPILCAERAANLTLKSK